MASMTITPKHPHPGKTWHRLVLLLWALLLALLAPGAHAQCGTINTTYVVHGGNGLSLSNDTSTVNGVGISGTGNSLQTTGVLRNATMAYPDHSPAAFPTFTGSNSSASTLAPGSYNTVTSINLTASAGTYYINTLSVSGTITLGAGTYYINTFALAAASTVNVTGNVRIFIGSLLYVDNNVAFNPSGSVTQLRVSFYDGTVAVISNYFAFTGLMYSNGLNTDITISNYAAITGAIVSKGTVTLANYAAFNLSPSNQTALGNAASTCPGPDHYELSLASSSLTCLPTTVTVKACANNSSPCTSTDSSASGATATLSSDGGAGTLSASSVTFNSSGVATATLNVPNAGNGGVVTVTLSGESLTAASARQCCPNGVSCSVANSCSTTFSTAGLIVASAANGGIATVPTQTAGVGSGTYYLRAIKTNTTTKACEAALTPGVSTLVNWGYQCNNPSTCSASNLMNVTGNGSTVTVSRNPNGVNTASTGVPMTFDANGNAPFNFVYNDVGQVTLNMGAATSNGASLKGNSNAFVVAPAKFALSNIKQTATPFLVNPGAADAIGGKFVKAGEAFTVTVTAQTSNGATTPNYGRETSAHGVVLTRNLVAPSGGAAGTLHRNGVAGSTIAGGSFSNGVATITDLSWSEVGVITLTPSIASGDGKYLGTVTVGATTSGNIGRFFPAKFAVSAASVTQRSASSCSPASTFTHLDEDFTLAFTLTAQNAYSTPGTTANYTGSFAKFVGTTASNWALAGVSGSQAFNTGNSRLGLGPVNGNWSNGTLAVSLIAQAKRASAPDGPFAASFGIAPTDSDGVAMTAYDMASVPSGGNDRTRLNGVSVPLRFGRLRLSNGIGPAGRSLALPVTAQYWTGSTWDTNTLDNCTSIATSALNFGKLRGSLVAADASANGAVTLSSGSGTLKLNAPGSNRTGGYELSISLTGSGATDQSCLQSWTPTTAASVGSNKQYLRGAWCTSTYDRDPSARATFGQYRGTDNLVYQRENY